MSARTSGARRLWRLRRAALATYVLAVGFMAVCALGFVILQRTLVGLFTRDAAIIALRGKLLLVAAAFPMFDDGQVAGVSVLRRAAETHSCGLTAAVRYYCPPSLRGLAASAPCGTTAIRSFQAVSSLGARSPPGEA